MAAAKPVASAEIIVDYNLVFTFFRRDGLLTDLIITKITSVAQGVINKEFLSNRIFIHVDDGEPTSNENEKLVSTSQCFEKLSLKMKGIILDHLSSCKKEERMKKVKFFTRIEDGKPVECIAILNK